MCGQKRGQPIPNIFPRTDDQYPMRAAAAIELSTSSVPAEQNDLTNTRFTERLNQQCRTNKVVSRLTYDSNVKTFCFYSSPYRSFMCWHLYRRLWIPRLHFIMEFLEAI